jgi:hypothetical protein
MRGLLLYAPPLPLYGGEPSEYCRICCVVPHGDHVHTYHMTLDVTTSYAEFMHTVSTTWTEMSEESYVMLWQWFVHNRDIDTPQRGIRRVTFEYDYDDVDL